MVLYTTGGKDEPHIIFIFVLLKNVKILITKQL
jgi:hypothetical protein